MDNSLHIHFTFICEKTAKQPVLLPEQFRLYRTFRIGFSSFVKRCHKVRYIFAGERSIIINSKLFSPSYWMDRVTPAKFINPIGPKLSGTRTHLIFSDKNNRSVSILQYLPLIGNRIGSARFHVSGVDSVFSPENDLFSFMPG